MNNYLVTLLLLTAASVYAQKEVNMYAIYTPSHEIMLNEWFLPSLKKVDNFNIVLTKCEQECKSAAYKRTGWKKTTIKKVQMIVQAVKDNWGSIFVYSDVDIQFFAPIKKDLLEQMRDNDLVIQRDDTRGRVCSGFFACRANQKTLKLWQGVLEYMQMHEEVSDQGALNYCLIKQADEYQMAWDYLPETYFGGGTLTTKAWLPGDRLPIPLGIKIHHANWTTGVENKIKQLDYVSRTVRARQLFWHGKRALVYAHLEF